MLWCIALPIGILVAMSKLADYRTEKGTSGDAFAWNLAMLPGRSRTCSAGPGRYFSPEV